MALHAPNYGSPSGLPLSAVLASIPSYPRPVIERLVSRLIDCMDEQDGDTDREPEDERGEDELEVWPFWQEPCPSGRHHDTGRGMCADCGAFL